MKSLSIFKQKSDLNLLIFFKLSLVLLLNSLQESQEVGIYKLGDIYSRLGKRLRYF